MKKLIYIILLILFSQFKESISQVPTYNLRAMNFGFVSVNHTDDGIEFDIYIEHTNTPTTFEYAGGQYYLEIEPLMANGEL